MADGVFRRKKGFTVIQNSVAWDVNVSLKAKGLYAIIQGNITRPDKAWKKSEFMRFMKEGEKCFENAWNELKEAGYLKVHMYSKAATWTVEYELLDESEHGPHTYYYNSRGELVRTNEGKVEVSKEKADGPEEQAYPSDPDPADRGDETSGCEREDATESSEESMCSVPEEEAKYTNNLVASTGGEEPQTRINTAYPQNGGNAENDALRTPHYGTYAKGTYADGTYAEGRYANGGNINKDYIVNTINKDCDHNHSLNHSESDDRADKKKDCINTVTLDPKDRIGDRRRKEIEEEMQAGGGIISFYPPDLQTIKEQIQVLMEWDQYFDTSPRDEWHKNVFRLTAECLIEMVCAPGVCEYKGDFVTSDRVIERINMIYRNFHGSEYRFSLFAELLVDRFIEIQKEIRIRNPKKYLKSLIWSSFSTYITDWESFFHRSYSLGRVQ